MYSLIISFCLGLVVLVSWGLANPFGGWIAAPIFGALASVLCLVLLGRRFAKIVEPSFSQAQKEAQTGQVGKAIQSLEGLLPYGRWYPLLGGQIHAQIGMLHFGDGNLDKALESFTKATPRVADAKMVEASIRYQRGDLVGAKNVLSLATRFNKRMVLLHNFLAFVHYKDDDPESAIAALERCLKYEKDNDATRENLNRVKQNNRMDMKQFGMPWYALKIERPPQSMGVMQQARKGFRQKPANPKKRGR